MELCHLSAKHHRNAEEDWRHLLVCPSPVQSPKHILKKGDEEMRARLDEADDQGKRCKKGAKVHTVLALVFAVGCKWDAGGASTQDVCSLNVLVLDLCDVALRGQKKMLTRAMGRTTPARNPKQLLL